jgi:hypothetical protein
MEIDMSNDVRKEPLPEAANSQEGPLRHFRVGRRAMLTTLAGMSAAAFTLPATAAHLHHTAAAATQPVDAAAASSSLLFLDQHAFDTLALLSEQIVPGSRAAQVPEVLDRLLSVESLETQKRFTSVMGMFEREAREAQGKPWKALTAQESAQSLTKISALPADDARRQAFDDLKRAVAETYYSTEPGLKEMGWTGQFAFAPPSICG